MELLSPTLATRKTGQPIEFSGRKSLQWARTALDKQENLGSPLHAVLSIAKHSRELTPHSEKITGNALRALLAPMPLPMLMDETDAKDCLEHVKDKVVTRAAKRKAAAVAAAAAIEARLMAHGAKRAAALQGQTRSRHSVRGRKACSTGMLSSLASCAAWRVGRLRR